MKNLFYEELEKVEELGVVSDFMGAAAPYIAMGIAVAVIISRSCMNDPKPSNSQK